MLCPPMAGSHLYVSAFPKLFASSKQSSVYAFVKTNALLGNALATRQRRTHKGEAFESGSQGYLVSVQKWGTSARYQHKKLLDIVSFGMIETILT